MSTSTIRIEPLAKDVAFTGDCLKVLLTDGREISVPLEWFPRLRDATRKQRSKWRLIGGGVGIHWEQIDEDISVESLLAPSCKVGRWGQSAGWGRPTDRCSPTVGGPRRRRFKACRGRGGN